MPHQWHSGELGQKGSNVKFTKLPILAASCWVVTRIAQHLHYSHIIDKHEYLEKSTRPAGIAFATHQCARFSSDS